MIIHGASNSNTTTNCGIYISNSWDISDYICNINCINCLKEIISYRGSNIKSVKNPSDEIILFALSKDINLIKFIDQNNLSEKAKIKIQEYLIIHDILE